MQQRDTNKRRLTGQNKTKLARSFKPLQKPGRPHLPHACACTVISLYQSLHAYVRLLLPETTFDTCGALLLSAPEGLASYVTLRYVRQVLRRASKAPSEHDAVLGTWCRHDTARHGMARSMACMVWRGRHGTPWQA